jgi:hypothetical protein
MANKGGRTTCRGCPRWQDVKSRMRIADLLANAADKFEKAKPDYKPTLAEYLKLVQLEQEFSDEETKEIKVTWVDPATEESKKSG